MNGPNPIPARIPEWISGPPDILIRLGDGGQWRCVWHRPDRFELTVSAPQVEAIVMRVEGPVEDSTAPEP